MKRPGDLAARVGVAAVGAPVVLGALWAGGWLLGGVIALAAAIGAVEFYRMAEARGERPFVVLGTVAAAAFPLLATAWPTVGRFGAPAVGTLLALAGWSMAAAIFRRWPEGKPSAAVASTLTGVIYVGLPLAFVPILRALPEIVLGASGALGEVVGGAVQSGWRLAGSDLAPMTAMSLILLPLLTTWAGDSSAYFVGHAIGRRKLAPEVSPGKTIEGSLGGLAGAVGAAVLITVWWIEPHPTIELSLPTAAWIGAVIGVATQVGDLAESLLKREAGVKDSGTIFPGHGGMLDRLDALLWAFPTTWFLLWTHGVIR